MDGFGRSDPAADLRTVRADARSDARQTHQQPRSLTEGGPFLGRAVPIVCATPRFICTELLLRPRNLERLGQRFNRDLPLIDEDGTLAFVPLSLGPHARCHPSR